MFLGTHAWEEIWNGDDIRNIRRKMLEGQKLDFCKQCWDEEKAGKISKRRKENKHYLKQNKERVKAAKDRGYACEQPFYLDLRMGNLCNLKCRTCNPEFSSSWQSEIKSMSEDTKNNSILHNASGSYLKGSLLIAEGMTKWYKNGNILEEIKGMSQSLKNIYFTGGEPLFIKEIEHLIDYFLKTGDSRHIELHFNSNITKLTSSFLEKMRSFLRVKFGASIDAYGKKITGFAPQVIFFKLTRI